MEWAPVDYRATVWYRRLQEERIPSAYSDGQYILTDILSMYCLMFLISCSTNSFKKHMYSSFTPNLCTPAVTHVDNIKTATDRARLARF